MQVQMQLTAHLCTVSGRMSFCAGMWRSISQLGQLTAARGGMQMLRRSAKTQSNFEGIVSHLILHSMVLVHRP